MKRLSTGSARVALAALGLLPGATVLANPVTVGGARFTVVTPECVRMEYHPEGHFIDAPSMFAVGRDVLAENVVVKRNDDTVVIDTGKIQISYTPNGRPFSRENLTAVVRAGDRVIAWKPESRQTHNLGGTIPTLDQVKGPVDLGEGILSRDGWYLLDDSRGFLLLNDWVEPRPVDAGTDWYLFGYGSDYKAAFKAFTTIAGEVPMPRKAVLGSWYSRWWHYTTEDYKNIVREYAEHDFPLDVIVMDMEWHTGPWTGWSWNHELLEDPPALLEWFHEQGLAVTLNVHPADGVAPVETMYPEFMHDLDADPESGNVIPFDAGDREYMEAYFRHTHHPREAEGVDFWWLDWQQYPDVLSIPGLRNLAWLNKLYFDNSMRCGKRGLQFSRWGGWGDHRHPIHFSGDADTGWEMLGFEVPFTSVAANEGAYFWSHDIGGHFGKRNEEPYARWVQFAATTAAMRLHSGIIEYLDRRPWKWPDWATESMRRSFHLRAELMPYVYSAVRETHETGVPLNRPMYVDSPNHAEAYEVPQQYMFGSDLLVANIASKGYGPGRVASQLVWFPPGEWFNFFTGESFEGPEWRLVCADINEIPLYVRGGVPIPMQPYSPRPTTQNLEKLVVHVWPGKEEETGSSTLYEDDALSREYEQGRFAKTLLSSTRNGNTTDIAIGATEGEFDGQVPERSYEIVVGCVEEPDSVKVDGVEGEFTWDQVQCRVTVSVSSRSIRKGAKVSIVAARADRSYFAGRELQRRLGEIDADAEDLTEAIKKAARSSPELLPGLVALGGFGIVENQTHYPHVGHLRRVVRNPDSVVSPDGTTIVHRRVETTEGSAVHEDRLELSSLTGPMGFAGPHREKPELPFLEKAIDDRALSFVLDDETITISTQLAVFSGGLKEWFVSEAYPFDTESAIDQQQYPPEELSLEELGSIEPDSVWKKVRANDDGLVDLLEARGGENCLAYAVATFEADSGPVVLAFRSDDGIEVWLNGVKIHSANVLRGIDHEWEETEADLRDGQNILLLKVSQANSNWEFMVSGRRTDDR